MLEYVGIVHVRVFSACHHIVTAYHKDRPKQYFMNTHYGPFGCTQYALVPKYIDLDKSFDITL